MSIVFEGVSRGGPTVDQIDTGLEISCVPCLNLGYSDTRAGLYRAIYAVRCPVAEPLRISRIRTPRTALKPNSSVPRR